MGDDIVLEPDGADEQTMVVVQRLGAAQLFFVADGPARGVLCIQPDGAYWWVRDLLPPEPWSAV